MLADVFGHHNGWLLAATIVALTLAWTARWANRAAARARLRRMRST